MLMSVYQHTLQHSPPARWYSVGFVVVASHAWRDGARAAARAGARAEGGTSVVRESFDLAKAKSL